MKKSLKIGITGGIGSGKTMVAKYVESLGHPVIYADEIAKQVMIGDGNVRERIVEAFGEESYLNGELNKEYLSENIFTNQDNLKLMNSIVHPPTMKRIKDLIYEKVGQTNFVFVEAALIYEAKFQHIFDYIILTVAEENLKIKRLLQREDTSVEEIIKKMKSQWQDSAKQDKADFIVTNNSTEEELYKKIDFILSVLEKVNK